LINAAVAGGASAETAFDLPVNLADASAEAILKVSKNPASGRTLQDNVGVIDLTTGSNTEADAVERVTTCLHPPVFVRNDPNVTKLKDPHVANSIVLASDVRLKAVEAAQQVGSFLEARDKLRVDTKQIRVIQRSLAFHRNILMELTKKRLALSTNSNLDPREYDIMDEETENSKRVIAQLERQLSTLEPVHDEASNDLLQLEAKALKLFRSARKASSGFRDPIHRPVIQPGKLNNRLLFNLCARQLGLDRFGGQTVPRSMGRQRMFAATAESRKAVFMARISHAVTINTHLAYPVYCLRFDRTGRYFVTGADDYLVRLFSLSEYLSPHDHKLDPSEYARGAVLVCTLRGHAGVINDIDISSDNSFLATASEDGDVRIWGMYDGCPIAILRGHTGGANMVNIGS
jgi:hypothetical protein